MRSEVEIQNAIELYADMIRRICFVQLKKEADVDDIFQNVFFKYAQYNKDFVSREHEKAWFIRVTMNECHSLLRKWFQRNVDLVDDLSVYGMQEEALQPELLRAVLTLPSNYRNVIYLYYYEGYKIVEIAELLKRKENTIHTWMKRAKEALREYIGGEEDEEIVTRP